MLEYDEEYYLEEDKLGMTVTAGSVKLEKNESNLIGISIGGGGKYCPCLYVVQVFDSTAASREGTLQSGDELTGVNGVNVKSKSKTQVAQLIQGSQGFVTIQYNKLHPEPKQGKSLDIALKKVKHRLVETMSSSTADAFGLSRAILCNDSLVKKLDDLTRAEDKYRALIDHAKLVFKAFFDLIQVYKKFGDVFCSIGVREIQQSANEAFNQFGEAHRLMEKHGIRMLKRLKPILGDLGTYLHKAIPDTRLTIKRYADVKFEYLSYCLKVKEMDDEEVQFAQLQEPLYRVETGNYEYRLVLRCRQDARASFAKLRSDVLVKMELLDSKHVQHLTSQLTRLVSVLADYHTECQRLMHDKHWFPIELDLTGTTLYTQPQDTYQYEEDEEEEDTLGDDCLLDVEQGTEADDVSALASALTADTSNEDLLSQLGSLALDATGADGGAGGYLLPGTADLMTPAADTGAQMLHGSNNSEMNLSCPLMMMSAQHHSAAGPAVSSDITGTAGPAVSSNMAGANGAMAGEAHFTVGGCLGNMSNTTAYPGINNTGLAFTGNCTANTEPNQLFDHTASQMNVPLETNSNIVTEQNLLSCSAMSMNASLNRESSSGSKVLSSGNKQSGSHGVGEGNSVTPVAGLSLLSQELMSEPSVDKQLEGFMTPDKKQQPSLPLLQQPLQATPAMDSLLLTSHDMHASTLLCSDDTTAQTAVQRDSLQDVSLLDNF